MASTAAPAPRHEVAHTQVVDSWIDFCAHELELPCTLWVYPIIGYMPFSGPAYGKAKAHVSQALKTLDAHLLDKTYMVGEAMTLADHVRLIQ